jgi:ABC-type sugar transport system substrate-binding protein
MKKLGVHPLIFIYLIMFIPISFDALFSLTIGFSQVGTESVWRIAETKSITNTAFSKGINLIYYNGQGKQENQIKALRRFIEKKVDGIILAPIVETGWEDILREIKQNKIPVIIVDRGIMVSDPSLYVTLISSDFLFEGMEAAQWLAKKMKGKANIVELQGTPGAEPSIDRKKGFEDEIKQYPNMKIIRSQTGNFNQSDGKLVMESFLEAEGKNINAVYAHNDDMAFGAVQAIEETGLKPGKDIMIVSIDGGKKTFEAMVAGKINCVVECNPLLGPLALEAIQKTLRGEKLPKWIKQTDKVFPSEIAKREMGKREY